MYKVQFVSIPKPGKGYIQGYASAKCAKDIVLKVNAQFDKDGQVYAVYLGRI